MTFTLCNEIEWQNIMLLHSNTHRLLTLELSSLKLKGGWHHGHPWMKLKFRLLNQEKRLTLAQFNGIFHLSTNEAAFFAQDFDVYKFWRQITFEIYFDPNQAPYSWFRILSLGYSKWWSLAHFWKKKDFATKVTSEELFLLCCLTTCEHTNLGYFIAQRMNRVSSGEFCQILVGGLVTRVAEHFEINLKSFP